MRMMKMQQKLQVLSKIRQRNDPLLKTIISILARKKLKIASLPNKLQRLKSPLTMFLPRGLEFVLADKFTSHLKRQI